MKGSMNDFTGSEAVLGQDRETGHRIGCAWSESSDSTGCEICSRVFGARHVGGFVGSCLRRRGRRFVLRSHRCADPGLGFPLPMSAEKFQGFNGWCE